MDTTSQKASKDPRRVEQGKTPYETRIKRLKEKILEDNQPPTSCTSSSTYDPTPSTFPSTCDPTPSTSSHTTRSSDNYVYGFGMLAVLAIGVCVFFAYNTFSKNQANDCPAAQPNEQKKPTKRRHML